MDAHEGAAGPDCIRIGVEGSLGVGAGEEVVGTLMGEELLVDEAYLQGEAALLALEQESALRGAAEAASASCLGLCTGESAAEWAMAEASPRGLEEWAVLSSTPTPEEAIATAAEVTELTDATAGCTAILYKFLDGSVGYLAPDAPYWQEAGEVTGQALERASRILEERGVPHRLQ